MFYELGKLVGNDENIESSYDSGTERLQIDLIDDHHESLPLEIPSMKRMEQFVMKVKLYEELDRLKEQNPRIRIFTEPNGIQYYNSKTQTFNTPPRRGK